MPPHSCIIRFVDGETQANVARNEHGHPEEIITNLSSLRVVTYNQEHQHPPGTIAAQFVFLDKLWYVLRDVAIGDLQEKLTGILYSPARTDVDDAGSYLRQHALLDSTSEVEPISYIYTVEIPDDGDWQIKIGENTHSFDGPVNEVFELLSWDFSGELAEAVQHL